MIIVAELDKALRAAGVPIDGVSMGRADDKQTWRIDFADGVTDEQKAAAEAALKAFDAEAEARKPEPLSLAERVAILEAAVAALTVRATK